MPEDTQSEIIDLGFDVNEADVARPVLQGGVFDFTIGSVKSSVSRKQNLPQLEVAYRLAQTVKDTQGRDVSPGFTITQRYLRQPVGKMTKDMIERRFKEIHFAAAGEGKVNTGAWVGKTVRCRVALREPHTDETTGETYPESNEITGVLPKK